MLPSLVSGNMMENRNLPNKVRVAGMTRFNKSGQTKAAIDQYEVVCALGSIGNSGRGLPSSGKRQRAVARGAGRAKLVFAAKIALYLRQLVEGPKKLQSAIETVKNDYTIASVLMCNNNRLQRADDEPKKCYRRLQISSHICSQKLLKLTGYVLAPGLLNRKA